MEFGFHQEMQRVAQKERKFVFKVYPSNVVKKHIFIKTMSKNGTPYKRVNILECKQGAVRAVRFNVDGCYCITCGSDKSLKLWNPYKGTLLHTFGGHGYDVLDARGSSDNSFIVSSGLDKSVMMWDVATGATLRKYRGHAARINALCLNEESTVICSASVDGSVRLWDVRSKNVIQKLNEAKDSVMSVSVYAQEILTVSLDGYTRIYDVKNGKLTSNCIGDELTWASFSGDGQCLLVSSVNSGLKLMDKTSGELLTEYSGHKTSDIKIESCFSSSDAQVFSGSEDPFVYCWDLISSKILFKLEHTGSHIVHSLSPHPEKESLLSATLGQVWLWAIDEES